MLRSVKINRLAGLAGSSSCFGPLPQLPGDVAAQTNRLRCQPVDAGLLANTLRFYLICCTLHGCLGRKSDGVLRNTVAAMPDSLRFLLIILCLAGAGYGLVWGLANFPPQQKEVIKQLSDGVIDY